MMMNSFFAIFLMVFGVSNAAFIHRGLELPEGYSEGSITWSGFEKVLNDSSLTHSADVQDLEGRTFTGTIQKVLAELESLGYSTDHLKPAPHAEGNATLEAGSDLDENSVDLSESSRHFRNCGVGGRGSVPFENAFDGAYYLEYLSDDLKCGNQPHTCGLISCSWWTGIWWCNDMDIMLDFRCNQFATAAFDVVFNCQEKPDILTTLVHGEAGDDGLKYRVQVGRSFDYC